MVLPNIDILVNKNSMIHLIKNIMNQVMLAYYDNEMLVEKIEEKKKVMENIVNEKINFVKTNHFWYM
jgi:hypothetical protein